MATYQPYSTGTIAVTNGSAAVVGTGTSWSAANGCFPGDKITIGGVDYFVQSVNGTTSLTLKTNFAGATASGLGYLISDKFDPPALTVGETVAINGGVTVNITTAAWAAAGMGNVTISEGKLRITNASTAVGFKVPTSTAAMSVGTSGRGTFEAVGAWLSIGTGTGAAGQTATHWDAAGDYVPCAWIETAAGSGVYEKYQNLTGHSVAHTRTLANVGPGNYGRFFTQAAGSPTLTFGDGVNGKAPPAGANIRVPNLIFTYLAALSTSMPSLNMAKMAVLLDTVTFARWAVSNANNVIRSFSASRVAFGVGNVVYTGMVAPTISDCCFNQIGNETQAPLTFNTSSSACKQVVLDNCCSWSAGSTTGLSIVSSEVEFRDCQLFSLNATSATYQCLTADAQANVTITRGVTQGGVKAPGTLTVSGGEYADNATLVESSTTSRNLFTLGPGSGYSLINWTVPSGGGPYGNIISFAGYVDGLTIRGVNINSARAYSFLYSTASFALTRWRLFDISVQGFRNAFYALYSPIASDFIFANIRIASYATSAIDALFNYGSNISIRGVGTSTVPTVATKLDSAWLETYTAATQGRLFYLASCPSAITASRVTLSGRAAFDMAGSLQLPAVGDSAVIECDHTIMGVTGFQSVTPSGAFAYLSLEYALDTGSGWGSWKTANASNLAAEVVSSSGFKFRLRATAALANANLSYVYLATNVDQAVLYPSALVTLTLRNINPGSRYYLANHSTGAIIAAGVASASTVAVANLPFYGDFLLDVRVRQASAAPKFIPFETQALVSSSGADVWVSQVQDAVAA